MYRQASFVADTLPKGTDIGPNGTIDAFSMPGIPGIEAPLHVGGDFAVAFTDDPNVWALMSWLASPESAAAWPGERGNIAPHVTFDYSAAEAPFSRRIAEVLTDAEALRFDASDLFPVRTGEAFNAGILQLIASGDVEAATEAIQTVAEMEQRRLGG